MANKTVTVRPSGGTYTTLDAAIDGEIVANANLTTLAGVLWIRPEGDWSSVQDTTLPSAVAFTNPTSAYYVRIEPDEANSFDGVYDASKYRLEAIGSWTHLLQINTDYTRVKGLQIKNTASSEGLETIRVPNQYCRVESCLVRGSDHASTGYYDFFTNNSGTIFTNCISIGSDGGGFRSYYESALYNCVAVGATGYGFNIETDPYLKNCYSGGNTGADYYSAGSPTLTTCFSEDGTRSTSTAAYSTATFTNVTSGSVDVTLVSGSGLIDQGTSLASDSYYPFNWDVAGTTRTGTWDVGAFEYVSTGGGVTIPRIIHHLRMQGVAA